MPGRHAQHRVLGAEDRAEHVGLHDFQDAEFRHFIDPRLVRDGAGVVDQCGDTPQLGIHSVEQRDHLIFNADIRTHGNRLGAQGTHLFEDAVGGGFIGLVVDADAIALASCQQCRLGANPAATPGDDDNFVHACGLLIQPDGYGWIQY